LEEKEISMATNSDRIRYLRERIKSLNGEIEAKNLWGDYENMLGEIKNGTRQFNPIDADDLEIMSPREREAHLLEHYHTLRTELASLKEQLKKEATEGKLESWLHTPWVKGTITIVEIASVATTILELLHHSGVFYHDEDQSDRFGQSY
jgi:hypothetical protein